MLRAMRAKHFITIGIAFLGLGGACGGRVSVFGDQDAAGSGGTVGFGGQDHSVTIGVGASGGDNAGGDNAGGDEPRPCDGPDDCTVSEDCLVAVCTDGECGFEFADAGTTCGSDNADICDDAGTCIKNIGKPCGDDNECFSQQCVDGVCCNTACEGVCEGCAISGSEGTCSPQALGTDPDDECNPGVCDGADSCIYGDDEARAVAIDDAGNSYVLGAFDGVLTLGSESYTSAGADDLFLVKLDNTGAVQWSKQFGGAGLDAARALTIDATSNVIIGGYFQSDISFDGGTTTLSTSANDNDAYIAKFDTDGNHLWNTQYGSDGQSQLVWDLVVDGTGTIVATGWFRGDISFDGGSTTFSSGGDRDIWVTRFDADGSVLNSFTFDDGSTQGGNHDRAYGIDADATGNIYLAGRFAGTLPLGNGITLTAQDDTDGFVAKINSSGVTQWANGMAGTFDQYARSVAVDDTGNVAVVGHYYSEPDFGGGALPNAEGFEAFAARFDSDGNHLWSQGYGTDGDQYLYDVALDSSSNLVIAGYFQGDISFDGGTTTLSAPVQSTSALLAKLAPDGGHLSSFAYGTAGTVQGLANAVNSSDDVAFAGVFDGSVDFGSGATNSVESDFFAVTLQP